MDKPKNLPRGGLLQAEIKPTPRNMLLGLLSDALIAGRDYANNVRIPQSSPLLGGQGVGSLLLGNAPEEVNEWSYGNSPVQVNMLAGRTASFVPEIKPGRKQSLGDTLLAVSPSNTGRRAAVAGLLGAFPSNMLAATAPVAARQLPEAASDAALRAVQQGYDQNWFHGYAGAPFDRFDPQMAGSVTGTPAAREAAFLTRSAEDAAAFARNADAAKGGGPSVMRMAVRPKNPATVTWKDSYPPIRSEGGQRFLAGLLMDAKEQGFDAVVIRGGQDALNSGSAADIMAVLDTGILRDTARAQFDPSRVGQNGLTLGIGGLGLGALMGRADRD